MSLVRLLGALCLILCGWCAGDAASRRVQGHPEALRRTISLLERLRREIGFRRCDLNRLCGQLVREKLLPEGTSSLQALLPFPALVPAEQVWFRECISGLGHEEAEQECRRLELYTTYFRDALQVCEPQARMRAELAHKLGLAAGLAAAILTL